jgi:CubicO group peptidase (beta-lactamase class C family)
VEDGLLGLNRPVQEYLPAFVGEGKENVMVHHLLTHTSGLREEDVPRHVQRKLAAGQIAAMADLERPGLEEFPEIRYFADSLDVPLHRSPGREMSYTGYGYQVLSAVIERAAGGSLSEVVHGRILDPLGMTSTFFGVPDQLKHRFVRREADSPWTRLMNHHDLIGLATGRAGVCSTAQDLGVFGQLFLNQGRYAGRRVLSPPSVAVMTRNQTAGIRATYGEEIFAEASWGFGPDVRGGKTAAYYPSLDSAATICHTGTGKSYWWVDPTFEIMGVLLTVKPEFGLLADPYLAIDHFVDTITAAVEEV